MSREDVEGTAAIWDSVTADAYRLVYGDRGVAYSHPAIDYGRTVDIFRAISGIELTAEEGVVFMLCVKLSRIANGFEEGQHAQMMRDSLVDLAGYTECLWGVMTYEPDQIDGEDDE